MLQILDELNLEAIVASMHLLNEIFQLAKSRNGYPDCFSRHVVPYRLQIAIFSSAHSVTSSQLDELIQHGCPRVVIEGVHVWIVWRPV